MPAMVAKKIAAKPKAAAAKKGSASKKPIAKTAAGRRSMIKASATKTALAGATSFVTPPKPRPQFTTSSGTSHGLPGALKTPAPSSAGKILRRPPAAAKAPKAAAEPESIPVFAGWETSPSAKKVRDLAEAYSGLSEGCID